GLCSIPFPNVQAAFFVFCAFSCNRPSPHLQRSPPWGWCPAVSLGAWKLSDKYCEDRPRTGVSEPGCAAGWRGPVGGSSEGSLLNVKNVYHGRDDNIYYVK